MACGVDAELVDPEGLLEGTGRFIRHVKLRPGGEREVDAAAVRRLIEEASADMVARVRGEEEGDPD